MLSKKEEIKALALINFYEYSSGIILGTVSNFIYRYLFPYHENESIVKYNEFCTSDHKIIVKYNGF